MTQIHYDDLNVQNDPRYIRCNPNCPLRVPPWSSGGVPLCIYPILREKREFPERVNNSDPCRHPDVFLTGKTLSIDILANLQESPSK